MSFEAITISVATKIGKALLDWAWQKQVAVSRAELERRRKRKGNESGNEMEMGTGAGFGIDRVGGTMRVRPVADVDTSRRDTDRPGEPGQPIGLDRSRDELREAMTAARIALREDGR